MTTPSTAVLYNKYSTAWVAQQDRAITGKNTPRAAYGHGWEVVPCGGVPTPPLGLSQEVTTPVVMSQTHPLPAQTETQHNHATANAPISRPRFSAAVWIGQSGKRPTKPKSSPAQPIAQAGRHPALGPAAPSQRSQRC
jgi:hypothetical protein